MPLSKLPAALATALVLAAVPAAAQAEYVPPNNSAAIQYTETIPTSRGQKDAEGDKGKVKPGKVLGEKNADRLESKGKQGKEVAEFAAETAPVPVTSDEGGSAQGDDPGSAGGKKSDSDEGAAGAAGGSGNGGSGGASPAGPGSATSASNNAAAGGNAATGPAEGSSALGEIAGQATGTSDGELGLLLPLVILAAVAWAAAFFWRQRRRIA
jgi:hypothetical protein